MILKLENGTLSENKEIFELGLGDKIWNKFHLYLKENLIEKTHTSISISNIGVLNIYSKLGYTFKNIKVNLLI